MFGSPTLRQSPETGLTESWEYDSQGRLKSSTAGGMRYEYSYDANNRLIEVQYPHILGNLKDGNTAFEKLSYDKAGNRTLRVTENLTEQYHYDNCNRLTRLDTTPTDLSKCQTIRFYRYDKQGNMLSDGANTYSYSPFNPKVLRGQPMRGQHILEIPVQNKPIPKAVIDYANSNNIIIRDVKGGIYN